MIDEMKPIMGTGNARIVRVIRRTNGAPEVETITASCDPAGETHRRISAPGNTMKAADPRALFADIDASMTNMLRELVADDRIEMFRA